MASPRTEVRGLMAPAYHVWFSPKKRKPVLIHDIADAVREFILATAKGHGIEVIEVETRYDHVHVLLRLPGGMWLSDAMKYLKGVSSRKLGLRFGEELKTDMKHEHFWQRGYGHRLVSRSQVATVARYIRNHKIDEDHAFPGMEPRTSVRGTVGSGGEDATRPLQLFGDTK